MCIGVLEFLRFTHPRYLGNYLDGVSDQIYIPSGFPFGLQRHTVAYVSCVVFLFSSYVVI